MNYSFLNNITNVNKEPEKLYRTYPSNVPIKNYNMNSYENSENDNWATEGSIQKTLLHGTMGPTPLGELFFSRPNIKRIQNKIKKEVFLRTDGKYVLNVEQNETDLLVNMRATFISDALNSPYKLVHQVKELNHKVIERIVPDMISMIKQNQQYLIEIEKPLQPIPLPVCVNIKGLRSLPSYTTTWGLKPPSQANFINETKKR